MRRLANVTGLALGSLLLGTSAYAQDSETALSEPEQEYLVELLFFRHKDETGDTQETWSARPRATAPEIDEEEVEISEEVLAAEEIKRSLAANLVRARRSEYQLLGISRKLASSRYYQPFAHIGWKQPGYLLDTAPSYRLNATLSGQGTLSGTATLSKGRHLRLDVHVEYRPQGGLPPLTSREDNQNSNLSGASSLTPEFHIREQRRSIKSNEIHYFDNPTFGIIARITPLLTDEPEVSTSDPGTAGQ